MEQVLNVDYVGFRGQHAQIVFFICWEMGQGIAFNLVFEFGEVKKDGFGVLLAVKGSSLRMLQLKSLDSRRRSTCSTLRNILRLADCLDITECAAESVSALGTSSPVPNTAPAPQPPSFA